MLFTESKVFFMTQKNTFSNMENTNWYLRCRDASPQLVQITFSALMLNY